MKVLVINRKKMYAFSLYLILIIFALLFMGHGISVSTSSAGKLIPIYKVETHKRQIAVTFDAAWGADDTDELISILEKHNAKATFFVLGEWADKYKDSVKKFDDAGHYIASHSYTHKNLSKMSRGEIRSQLAKCNESIKAITGKDNMLFRPPSGAYNNDVVDAASSLGMYTIQWSLDSLDYEGLSEKQIFDRIVPKVKNGDIILFHNDIKNTPKALDQILHALKDKGFEFVSAYDLIYKENYTIDYSGMQKQVQNIH